MSKKKLKKYKVSWEESRYIIVKAESEEEAREIVMLGNFTEKDVCSGELTSQPEAFEETL